MKQFNKILFSSACLAMSLTSCSDMFDEKLNNQWNEDYVWSVANLSEGVLNSVYKAIADRPDSYDGNFLDAATDNAITSQYGSKIYSLANGDYSATNNPIGNWSSCYKQFQQINIFLEKGLTDQVLYDKESPSTDTEIKDRLKGEAYFLRAFWGFKLLQMYGGKTETGEALGYPLKMHFVTEEEALFLKDIKRDTYAECAAQIIQDCDSAAVYLPLFYAGTSPVTGISELGRASGLASAALKSKVALYAASPAYRSDDVTKIVRMGQFGVINEDEYNKGWVAAVGASSEALNMMGNTFTPMIPSHLADAPNATPGDFLLRFFYNNREHETRHFPPFYFGKANTVPSQNLVDAFAMANGFPISDPRSGYDPENPYAGRESRFEMNIYHHGEAFGNDTTRTLDMTSAGFESPQYDRFGSRTGYYLAKFLSKDYSILDPISPKNKNHYYPLLRKTEVFLNYAEAANEAFGPHGKGMYVDSYGNEQFTNFTAYEVLKMIRLESAGITDTQYLDEMASNKMDFRKLIQNERRVELAFENQRYFDLRRCLLPLNEDIKGVEVTVVGGKTEYNQTKVVEQRDFNSTKYYYAPIPYNETVKNPNIVNNLGWK